MKELDASSSSSLLDDALFCEEETWEVEDEEQEQSEVCDFDFNNVNGGKGCLFVIREEDLFWEDEELESLFLREAEQRKRFYEPSVSVSEARREAVEWVVKVNARFGFASVTAILAVDYIDRFLGSVQFQRDKPWMVQLVAVTCLSLAAKVEETQVPLLLDLQVEDTRFVFESKTIQRMELLVLSTLQWKMHPVTPISFLDHIVRRLGLRTHRHWEFLRRCERLLLAAVSDTRFVSYLPSVVATATMMVVVDDVEPCHACEYRDQLLSILRTSKETVNRCYELISELSEADNTNPCKRKSSDRVPRSPIGVIDASFGSDDSSSSSSSACSSAETEHALFQKSKKHKCLVSTNRVLVEFVGSPR